VTNPDPHPDSADVAGLSAIDLTRRLAAGELTSRDVVAVLSARIGALDVSGDLALHSVAALSDDATAVALERDAERSRGVVRGALHGVPVLIKDNIEAVGLPGQAGSTALAGRPARDAALVQRLRDAGAIVMGSTNLSQWANIRSPHSTSGFSASGGLVGNPWCLDRSAGGSSSGAGAALAAGFAPLTVGTETDGSITCPASLNGVFGLKPTVGNVSRDGVVPISHSQDSPGPLARTAGDLALLYGVLSATTPPPQASPARLVVATSWRTGHDATDALFDEVLATWGVDLSRRDASLPAGQEFDDELTVLLCELLDDMDAYLAARPGDGVSSLSDVVAYEDAHREVEQRYFGHEFFERALTSGGCASEAYQLARERNYHWATQQALGPLLGDADVVLAPAYGPAWKSDLVNGDNAKYVSASIMAAAIAGWPILTVPVGLVEGLPVGLTLTGRPQSEWTLLAVARQLEEHLGHRGGAVSPSWRAPSRG